MLALLDSLLSCGFDPEDQGRRAVAWRRDGAYAPGGVVFDIGGTTSAALAAIERGTPALEAGPTGEHSQSNGSLMRILPLALSGLGELDAGLRSSHSRGWTSGVSALCFCQRAGIGAWRRCRRDSRYVLACC